MNKLNLVVPWAPGMQVPGPTVALKLSGSQASRMPTVKVCTAPGANSGIMYRVEESEDSPGFTGPEYQILDNAKHPDGRKKETSAASCYGLYAPSEDATKPIGEWNLTRIVVKGDHVEHWLNGKKVVEYEFGSDDWNKRVAASKFKEFKKFGLVKKGEIDLQDHGDDVSYRNIKIRALGAK